ncbi:hypothetical protein Btru_016178 [Bulinus truncatus]|nr:hypothetical protein Btru_016178 [Bulinus truncatus]
MQVSAFPGGAGRLFVLSTVTGLHQPRTTIGFCIGSHGHGDTVVNVTGGHLSRNLSYVMKRYKVVCVDLTHDMVQTDLDEYNAVVVNSSGQVTVTVTIRSNTTVTSYLALPVDAWGNQYLFLVAQIYHSVVQVMSGVSSSDVIVTVKFPPPSYSNVSQHLDGHNVTLTHRVAPYKVWITSFCHRQHDLTPALSGVLELSGDHYFGVILTKCHRFKTDCSTYVDRNETKDRPVDDKRTGQLASWAWPVELLGQEFIVLGLNWTAITHVMLVSTEANTSVSMMAGDSENYTTVHLAEGRSFHVMRATFSTLTVHSTEPIYVYILRCECQDVVADVTDILRDVTLPVFVLPTCLFYHTYLWRSSFSNNPAIVETLITILPVSHEDVLSLDGTRLYKLNRTEVAGNHNWVIGLIELTPSRAHLISSVDQVVHFGCYLKTTPTGDESESHLRLLGQDTPSFNVSHRDRRSLRDKRFWPTQKPRLYRRHIIEIMNCTFICKPYSMVITQKVCSLLTTSYDYDCGTLGSRTDPIINMTVTCPWKTICPEDCPLFKWGYNCTGTCLNCEVECDKFNGECDECILGYTYSDSVKRVCDKQCPKNTYGKMCRFDCLKKCGQDCASRLDGSCPACEAKKWGLGCRKSCPEHCEHNCTLEQGHCQSCEPGYTHEPGESPLCQQECSDGSYGSNCNRDCSPNCATTCDKRTGACDKCKKGFMNSAGLESCGQECLPLTYGENCDGSCQEKCGMECKDKAEGTCPECPVGKWGKGCVNSCGKNCVDLCDRTTGECHKCKKGTYKDFRNPFCDKECDPLHFGENCQGSCEEVCGRECAENIDGTCKPCENGTWGFGCKNLCSRNCFGNCHNSTGECISCKPGFRDAPGDRTCMADCPPMTFGFNCNGSCQEKCKGQECVEKVLGLCVHCPEFKWGHNCSHQCSENCEGDCNKGTGECSGCKKGFISKSRREPFCQLTCPPMTYGNSCEGLCLEKCNTECLDKVEGRCPDKMKLSHKIAIFVGVVMVFLGLVCYLGSGNARKDSEKTTSTTTSYPYPRSSNSDTQMNQADSRGSDIADRASRYGSDIDRRSTRSARQSMASTTYSGTQRPHRVSNVKSSTSLRSTDPDLKTPVRFPLPPSWNGIPC